MGWPETRRRWQILREIESALADDESDSTDLPWSEEYADLFGDRAGLVRMLRYRCRIAYDAQLDPHLPEPVLDEQRRRLDVRLAAVHRLLARHPEPTRPAPGSAHVAA
jgi:hypothetical protein